jgi:integrase
MTSRSETTDPRAVEWCFRAFLDNLCPNTKRAYVRDLGIFAQWRGAQDSLSAIQGFIAQRLTIALEEGGRYSQWLFTHERAWRTAVRRLAALRSVVRQLETDGIIAWSLPLPSPARNANDRQRDFDNDKLRPNAETLSRLMNELRDSERNLTLRDRLIVYFGSILLMRNIELERLRLRDIDWDASAIVVHGIGNPSRKGRRPPRIRIRTVPIPAAILPDLRRWASTVSLAGAEHLFVRVRWNDAVSAAGLRNQAFSTIARKWFRRLGLRGNMRMLRSAGMAAMLDQMEASGASLGDIAEVAGITNVAQLARKWTPSKLTAGRGVVETAALALSPGAS